MLNKNVIITIFFITILAGTFTFGPFKRKYASPAKVVSVKTAQEIDSLWHSSGVHGRIAIIFARHLDQQFSKKKFPEIDYLDKAMRHGIIRTVYYVTPDITWSEVVSEYLMERELMAPLKSTDTGYRLLHEAGRINAMPFSKYIPQQEKALIIIEKGIWTQTEQNRIENYLKAGFLQTDLLIQIQTAEPYTTTPHPADDRPLQ